MSATATIPTNAVFTCEVEPLSDGRPTTVHWRWRNPRHVQVALALVLMTGTVPANTLTRIHARTEGPVRRLLDIQAPRFIDGTGPTLQIPFHGLTFAIAYGGGAPTQPYAIEVGLAIDRIEENVRVGRLRDPKAPDDWPSEQMRWFSRALSRGYLDADGNTVDVAALLIPSSSDESPTP